MLTLPLVEGAATGTELSEKSIDHHSQKTALSPIAQPSVLDIQSSAPASTRIRILLVDDHIMVRQGLRAVLDGYADVELVGEASSLSPASALVEQLAARRHRSDSSLPDRIAPSVDLST